jgi:hypothetical protein
VFVPNSSAKRAKERGYEQHLMNRDLADQLNEGGAITEDRCPWELNDPDPDWAVQMGREMEAIDERYAAEMVARQKPDPYEREMRAILDELYAEAARKSETPFMAWLRTLSIEGTNSPNETPRCSHIGQVGNFCSCCGLFLQNKP